MTTIKKAQTGAKVVEKKTTVKVTPKKPKTASQRIGDLTLRDVKDSAETALNIYTLGGYKAAKRGVKKLTGMKTGGKISKAKNGKSIKKAQMGGKFGDIGKSTPSTPSIPTGNNAGSSQKKITAKSGTSMKTCKGGC